MGTASGLIGWGDGTVTAADLEKKAAWMAGRLEGTIRMGKAR